MTTPESPSVLLQRAADELERLAAHFAVYEEEQERSSEFPTAAARWIHLNAPTASHLPANEWMWTMTPAVAAPLVAWLRMAAKEYESREHLPKLGGPNPYGAPIDLTGSGLFGPLHWELALDLAKQVLGQDKEAT